MNYCSVQDVIGHTQDEEMLVASLNILIPAISRAIDGYCHRSFATSNEGRIYDYPKGDKIWLRDDLISLTTIETNAGQSFDDTYFFLCPISGPPYAWIELGPSTTLSWATTPKRALTITGNWGYAASVPDNIKLATVIWSAALYAQATTAGLIKVDGGDISMTLRELTKDPPAEVLPLLVPHIRPRIAAIGAR